MKYDYKRAKRIKKLTKLRDHLTWLEKDIQKHIAKTLDSIYAADYAEQMRQNLLKQYGLLIHIDALKVVINMELNGTATHRITEPPQIELILNDPPRMWRGDKPEPTYTLKITSHSGRGYPP